MSNIIKLLGFFLITGMSFCIRPGYAMDRIEASAAQGESDNPPSRVLNILNPGQRLDHPREQVLVVHGGFQIVVGSALSIAPEGGILDEPPASRVSSQALRWKKILPEEMTLKILESLSVADLNSISQTCKYFNRICRDRDLWKSVTLKTVGDLRAFSILCRQDPYLSLRCIQIDRFLGLEGARIAESMERLSARFRVTNVKIIQNSGRFLGDLPFDSEKIELDGCNLRGASIEEVALQNLPPFLKWLTQGSRLSSIKLRGVRLELLDISAILEQLSDRFPQLTCLELSDNTTLARDEPFSIEPVSRFAGLTTLVMEGQRLSSPSYSVLSGLMTHLRILSLNSAGMEDEDLEALFEPNTPERILSLEKLDIGNNSFTQRAVGILDQNWQYFPDLGVLDISNLPTSMPAVEDGDGEESASEGVSARSFLGGLMRGIKKLTHLTAAQCDLRGRNGDTFLSHQLQKLVLNANPLGGAGLYFVSPTLRELSLEGALLEDRHVEPLLTAVRFMPLLETLNLDDNRFSDSCREDFLMYFFGINQITAMREWSMRRNQFSQDQMYHFLAISYGLKRYLVNLRL